MARRDAGAALLRGVHVLLVCDDVERSALFAGVEICERAHDDVRVTR